MSSQLPRLIPHPGSAWSGQQSIIAECPPSGALGLTVRFRTHRAATEESRALVRDTFAAIDERLAVAIETHPQFPRLAELHTRLVETRRAFSEASVRLSRLKQTGKASKPALARAKAEVAKRKGALLTADEVYGEAFAGVREDVLDTSRVIYADVVALLRKSADRRLAKLLQKHGPELLELLLSAHTLEGVQSHANEQAMQGRAISVLSRTLGKHVPAK